MRKDNARLQEARAIPKKAAAYFAQQLPCRTLGCLSSLLSSRSVTCVSSWRARAVAIMSGLADPPVPTLTPRSRWRRQSSSILPRAVVPTAHAGSNTCWRSRVCPSAAVASGASWSRQVCAAQPGRNAKHLPP
jgi:hypothetical protein